MYYMFKKWKLSETHIHHTHRLYISTKSTEWALACKCAFKPTCTHIMEIQTYTHIVDHQCHTQI